MNDTTPSSSAAAWPGGIAAVTLVVGDLAAARAFYSDVFGLVASHEDDDSAVFRFGAATVNLLRREAAPELIAPALVADAAAGSRTVLSLEVDEVDVTCAGWEERGVALLNGPMDRPRAVRTASFRDPGGHSWEIAH